MEYYIYLLWLPSTVLLLKRNLLSYKGVDTLFSWSWGTPLPINHIFGGKFGTISWNKLIILYGDMKCVLLIIFLIQSLINSDNPIPIWLRWIWNSTFWLWVEYLKNRDNMTKYKIQEHVPNTSGNKMLFIPHFYSLLMNTSTLGQNQSLKNLGSIPEVKKIWLMIGKTIWAKRGIGEKEWFLAKKHLGGSGWW